MERKVEKSERQIDYLTLSSIEKGLEAIQKKLDTGIATAEQSGVEAIRINVERALFAVKNELRRYPTEGS